MTVDRVEAELKYWASDEGPLRDLAAAQNLGPAELGPARTVEEVDRYLDTADLRLASRHWACRLRAREGRIVVSLKGPAQHPSGDSLHRRAEVEGPAGPTLAPMAWPPSVARQRLLEMTGGEALIERFSLEQDRTERSVSLNATNVGLLSLDRGRVMHRGIELGRLAVVELELDPAALAAGLDHGPLADALAAIPVLRDPLTKLEHALGTGVGGRPMTSRILLRWRGRRARSRSTSAGTALWDPRLQLGLHLVAAIAIGGVVVLAWRGGLLPRTPLDRPIAALLVVYGVATLSAWNIGLSVPALAGILATAAMLPVGLLALRHRPDWTALIAVVPVLALSAGAVVVLAWRRVEWVMAGGVGWPPIRLPNDANPFDVSCLPSSSWLQCRSRCS